VPVALPVIFGGAAGQNLGNLAMIDRVLLDRVQSWQDTATWGDVPPTNIDTVMLDPDAAVSLSGTCAAATVEVQGTLLADAVDGSLATRWLYVHGLNSRFRVGTELTPFAHQFTLTLTGPPSTENVNNTAGTKFLMAMDNGHVDMHGLPVTSWTRLTSVNGAVIKLADPVAWQVGDEIVVARSSLMHFDSTIQASGPESEQRRIVAINAATGEFTLDQSFAFKHVANPPVTTTSGSQSWVLDERAEVGLLTHNVKVEGDASSTTSRFGAHVMMMHCSMCANVGGFGRFENIELHRVGQNAPALNDYHLALGRYPMHWHMQAANGKGQYLRHSSIHESYNRAVTVHGSDYVVVEDNVAYDQVGHAIFFEDGGEQHNQILHNLVLVTRKPVSGQELLTTDNAWDQAQNRSPAVFWITNPNNDFIGNVAVESEGTGYWFALHPHPFGLSSQTHYYVGQSIDATHGPLGAFRDNVCHSCRSGIDLNDSVDNMSTLDPHDDLLLPNVGWLPPAPVTLDHFVAYGCATAIYAGAGSDMVTFTGSVMADNEWHVQIACGFTVTGALIVEDSQNGIFLPIHPSFSGSAYVAYDGPGRLTDSHLIGFSGAVNTYATVVSSVFGAAMRHTDHFFSGLTFELGGAVPRITFDDFATLDTQHQQHPLSPADSRQWGIAVFDQDGSLSNGTRPGYTLVVDHPMMHVVNANGSTPDVTFAQWTNAWLSPFEWGHLVVKHFDANDLLLDASLQPPMVFTRQSFEGWDPASYTYDFTVDPYRQMPLVVRRQSEPATRECWYLVDWSSPSTSKKIKVTIEEIGTQDVTRLHMHNGSGWSNATVSVGGVVLTPVASIPALDGLPATAYALRSGDIYLRIVGVQTVTITWP